jgi:hypothetical protein
MADGSYGSGSGSSLCANWALLKQVLSTPDSVLCRMQDVDDIDVDVDAAHFVIHKKRARGYRMRWQPKGHLKTNTKKQGTKKQSQKTIDRLPLFSFFFLFF